MKSETGSPESAGEIREEEEKWVMKRAALRAPLVVLLQSDSFGLMFPNINRLYLILRVLPPFILICFVLLTAF